MNLPNERSSTHGPDAEADARDVEAFSVLGDLSLTTLSLRRLAAKPHWATSPFCAEDVTASRRLLRTCLQSLNRIESELDKRA
jgi:hypothetical protein